MDLFGYLFVSIVLNIVMFSFAFIVRTDMLTDVTYATTFIVLSALALLAHHPTPFSIVAVAFVWIWASRLGSFLFLRIRQSRRDRRFNGIRDSLIRFFGFWMLQGLAVWVLLMPLFFFVRIEEHSVFWVGALIWFVGLLIESVADLQKRRFTKNHRTHRFIMTGLWRYSRHPNYFGEILCWVGIYLFVFPSLPLLERFIALASPLFIALVLIFVTGIPPLERQARERWGEDRAYRAYVERTSLLVPWPPKRS
jgi:steroid 5-alpha reductase family enzyme